VSVIAEPDRELGHAHLGKTLVVGPAHLQPSRTVKVPLLDDESLLAQMHQKQRYNIRLARRRGVSIREAPPDDEHVSVFYSLLEDTSVRNEFGIHDLGYYREFLRTFGDDAVLMFADVEGRPAAGLIAAFCGEEAIYMYGASSTKDRAHAAGFLIQFEAMRWARARGCRRYDLWGIPAVDPDSTKIDNGDRIAGTSGDDWRGLYEYKTRFGGEIVEYPSTVERQYHPLLSMLAQRVYRAWT
jgi:lipid II:glycine glycyltransferase (peptidoglycan interpeptide bridge formation enzyme)